MPYKDPEKSKEYRKIWKRNNRDKCNEYQRRRRKKVGRNPSRVTYDLEYRDQVNAKRRANWASDQSLGKKRNERFNRKYWIDPEYRKIYLEKEMAKHRKQRESDKRTKAILQMFGFLWSFNSQEVQDAINTIHNSEGDNPRDRP